MITFLMFCICVPDFFSFYVTVFLTIHKWSFINFETAILLKQLFPFLPFMSLKNICALQINTGKGKAVFIKL